MKLFSVFKEVNKSNARLAATSGAYRSRVPLKPVRRSGECCKLSKRGPGGAPTENKFGALDVRKPLVAIIRSILKCMFYSCHLSGVP